MMYIIYSSLTLLCEDLSLNPYLCTYEYASLYVEVSGPCPSSWHRDSSGPAALKRLWSDVYGSFRIPEIKNCCDWGRQCVGLSGSPKSIGMLHTAYISCFIYLEAKTVRGLNENLFATSFQSQDSISHQYSKEQPDLPLKVKGLNSQIRELQPLLEF